MENLKIEDDNRMRELEDKAHAIMAQAVKEAKDRSEKLERETHEEIRRRKEMALAELERERTAAITALKSEVADLAVQIASTVLSREVNERDHHKIVQDFLADMEKRAN
jgi:F-type H+-transporting ATPase subunit b